MPGNSSYRIWRASLVTFFAWTSFCVFGLSFLVLLVTEVIG